MHPYLILLHLNIYINAMHYTVYAPIIQPMKELILHNLILILNGLCAMNSAYVFTDKPIHQSPPATKLCMQSLTDELAN